MPTRNPGLDLFNWLQKHFPIRRSEPSTWIKKIADELSYEGIDKFLWNATLRMVLRRLLATRELYRREMRGGDQPEEAFLREFIRPTFSLNRTECRNLSNLVEDAYRSYLREIPERLKKKAHNKTRELGTSCDLCGKELQAEIPQDHDYATLDHIWPRALGGPPTEENLRLTCQSCNNSRQDIIGLCDTDFQLFHIRAPATHKSYSKEFPRKYRIAVTDDFQQECAICSAPVLTPRFPHNFRPIRRDEAPGTFNVQLVCDRHQQRGPNA